jgi:hypothetical protein
VSHGQESCAVGVALGGAPHSQPVFSLEATLRRRPRLEVLSSSRGPVPDWAVPPLLEEGTVVLRHTAYRLDGAALSRHLAAIDLAALGADRARELEEGRASLADLLERPGVERTGLRVEWIPPGPGPVGLPSELRAAIGAGPFVARRYEVAVDGVPAGVVFEVLPCEAWERVVAPPARLDQGTGR